MPDYGFLMEIRCIADDVTTGWFRFFIRTEFPGYPDAQKAAVVKRLLETTKYVTFEMHYEVDSAIIGGMMIRIGDRVVDSTVRTKLYDLTRELSKIQLKAGECAP